MLANVVRRPTLFENAKTSSTTEFGRDSSERVLPLEN
jgi:hypothetical protein